MPTVTIKKTKVGDPTVLFVFSLDEDCRGANVKLSLNGKQVLDIDLDTVPANEEVILMAPFSYTGGIPTNAIAATATYTWQSGGQNTYEIPNVELVVPAPVFTFPKEGSSKIVAIQCVDDSGNIAFLRYDGDDDIVMRDTFQSLKSRLKWELTMVDPSNKNKCYLRSMESGKYLYIKDDQTKVYTTKDSHHLHFSPVTGADETVVYTIHRHDRYLKGDTSNGKVTAELSPDDSKQFRWYIHDLAQEEG